jgi:hypothetical protein
MSKRPAKRKYVVIAVIFAMLALIATAILFACGSGGKSEKIKLGFEWSNLRGYEYDAETEQEYLTFRYVPPERYGNKVTDYDWVYIRVNAEDYQPVERPARPATDADWRERTDLFPFWEDDMRLDNVQDSPDGGKSIIIVFVPELESGHPYSRLTSRFLREGDTYTQIEEAPFPNAYGESIEFATNTLIRNSKNPLYLYDTDTKQWFPALPDDSKYHAAYNLQPLWINEQEFLVILNDRSQKNYAARIDCLAQSIVTALPLKGDVRYAAWSEKKIGVLWYQPDQLSGATLYRLDMGFTPEENTEIITQKP